MLLSHEQNARCESSIFSLVRRDDIRRLAVVLVVDVEWWRLFAHFETGRLGYPLHVPRLLIRKMQELSEGLEGSGEGLSEAGRQQLMRLPASLSYLR